ncbi:GrpB family protein [Streptomyces erythrochromogenes]|uniref:GrpB family protein n=1 Tax=Streptomyces erythrochromogenes TaxID=285574 RepID=UPI00342C6493
MAITVVPYSDDWPVRFERLAETLRAALRSVPDAVVEHVGSTSVPGLAAKPVLDVDVIVPGEDVPAAVAALEAVGYVHRGDLGVAGREAFRAPDDDPARHVYVCTRGTLNVRNHLAVREVLRRRADLREEYGAVKLALAANPRMDMPAYLEGKTAVLQKVLAAAAGDFTQDELRQIRRLNGSDA